MTVTEVFFAGFACERATAPCATDKNAMSSASANTIATRNEPGRCPIFFLPANTVLRPVGISPPLEAPLFEQAASMFDPRRSECPLRGNSLATKCDASTGCGQRQLGTSTI